VQDMNSWEADLKGVKVEYLALNSNIQDPEIYSLRPQASITNPSKIEKECRSNFGPQLKPSRKVPREQSFRGWTVVESQLV